MTKNPLRFCATRVKNLSLLILFSPNLNFILNLGRQRDVLRRVAVLGFRELDFDAVRPQRVDDRASAVKPDRHAPFAGFGFHGDEKRFFNAHFADSKRHINDRRIDQPDFRADDV